MTDATPPVLDEAKLDNLGRTLFSRWGTYVTDRKMIEERWLSNLRQVRKIYDPEVLKMIPADRSKAYPGITQYMVRGTIARLMQMLWPKGEKNYGVKNSPLPDLEKEQLQYVLDVLVAHKAETQQIDPKTVKLTDEEIEKAIVEYAAGKAERMEVKIDDDLQEMEFITLARRVVKSATTYNVGIAVGPMHRKVPARTWKQDAFTGAWTAVDGVKFKPLFQFLPVWDHYFDMTAVAIERQDGTFDRHVMARTEVEALADRKDFMSTRVLKFLADNPNGNYKPQWWETEIKGEKKSATATVATKETRKFEALSYSGPVSGHDLRAAGVEVSDEDLGRSFRATGWTLGEVLIKLKLAPLGDDVKTHHYFVFEEDDLSILGNGQCDVLRDSQFAICEVVRAALDNASVIGPMVEVNDDLLTPGQDVSIRKHKTWRREGEGASSQYPAVRDISIDSHLPDLLQLHALFMSMAEKESGLPPPSVGDVSGGGSEALRTSKNASMFLGAAALPIRDTVRNYDSFTISVISSLVAWNKKYDPSDSRDGDHDIIARGSTSLMAKEVMAQALNEFKASLTPDELPHLKTRKMLEMRMKLNELPTDELLEDEDTANEIIARQQQEQQAQQQQASDLMQAQVEESLAKAMRSAAEARKADGSIGVDVFEAIIAGLEAGAASRAAAAAASANMVKSQAALIAAKKKPAGSKK